MAAIYEQADPCAMLGYTLRPGGLALTDEVLTACGLPAGARVLDVGCGAGATVAHLRSRHGLVAVGIDASAALLVAARHQASGLPVGLALAARLPVGNGLLDAVIAECTLSLTPDTGATLAEFRRVLKPGGWILLTDLYVREEDGTLPSFDRACSGLLTKTQMARRLTGHAFDLLEWRDRSDALKVFAARLIFAGIPLAALAGEGCAAAVAHHRLGYYWLVARKGV